MGKKSGSTLVKQAREFLASLTDRHGVEASPPQLIQYLELCPASAVDNLSHSTPGLSEYRHLISGDGRTAPFAPFSMQSYLRLIMFMDRVASGSSKAAPKKASKRTSEGEQGEEGEEGGFKQGGGLVFDKKITPSTSEFAQSLQQKLAVRKSAIQLIDDLREIKNVENSAYTIEDIITLLQSLAEGGKKDLTEYVLQRIVMGMFGGVLHRSIVYTIALCAILCVVPPETSRAAIEDITGLLEQIANGSGPRFNDFEGMKPSGILLNSLFVVCALMGMNSAGHAMTLPTQKVCFRILCAAHQRSPGSRTWATELLGELCKIMKRKHIESLQGPLVESYFSNDVLRTAVTEMSPEALRLALALRVLFKDSPGAGIFKDIAQLDVLVPSVMTGIAKNLYENVQVWQVHPSRHPVFDGLLAELAATCDAAPEGAEGKIRAFVRDFARKFPTESAPQRAVARYINGTLCNLAATKVHGAASNRLLFDITKSLELNSLPNLTPLTLPELEALSAKDLTRIGRSLMTQFHDASSDTYKLEEKIDMDVDSDDDGEEGDDDMFGGGGSRKKSHFCHRVRGFLLRQLNLVVRARVPEENVGVMDDFVTDVCKFYFMNGVLQTPEGAVADPTGPAIDLSDVDRGTCLTQLSQLISARTRAERSQTEVQKHNHKVHGNLKVTAIEFLKPLLQFASGGTVECAFSGSIGFDRPALPKEIVKAAKSHAPHIRVLGLLLVLVMVDNTDPEEDEEAFARDCQAYVSALLSNASPLAVLVRLYCRSAAPQHAAKVFTALCDEIEVLFKDHLASSVTALDMESFQPASAQKDKKSKAEPTAPNPPTKAPASKASSPVPKKAAGKKAPVAADEDDEEDEDSDIDDESDDDDVESPEGDSHKGIQAQTKCLKLLALLIEKRPDFIPIYSLVLPWLQLGITLSGNKSLPPHIIQPIKNLFRQMQSMNGISSTNGKQHPAIVTSVVSEIIPFLQSLIFRRSNDPQRFSWLKESALQIASSFLTKGCEKTVAAALGPFFVEILFSEKSGLRSAHVLNALKKDLVATNTYVLPEMLKKLKTFQNVLEQSRHATHVIQEALDLLCRLQQQPSTTTEATKSEGFPEANAHLLAALSIWGDAAKVLKGEVDPKKGAPFLDAVLPAYLRGLKIPSIKDKVSTFTKSYLSTIVSNKISVTSKCKSILRDIAKITQQTLSTADFESIPVIGKKSLRSEQQIKDQKAKEKRARELEEKAAEKAKENGDGQDAKQGDVQQRKKPKKDKAAKELKRPLTEQEKKDKTLKRQAIIAKKRDKRKELAEKRKAMSAPKGVKKKRRLNKKALKGQAKKVVVGGGRKKGARKSK